jgi:hypothetical protein
MVAGDQLWLSACLVVSDIIDVDEYGLRSWTWMDIVFVELLRI